MLPHAPPPHFRQISTIGKRVGHGNHLVVHEEFNAVEQRPLDVFRALLSVLFQGLRATSISAAPGRRARLVRNMSSIIASSDLPPATNCWTRLPFSASTRPLIIGARHQQRLQRGGFVPVRHLGGAIAWKNASMMLEISAVLPRISDIFRRGQLFNPGDT